MNACDLLDALVAVTSGSRPGAAMEAESVARDILANRPVSDGQSGQQYPEDEPWPTAMVCRLYLALFRFTLGIVPDARAVLLEAEALVHAAEGLGRPSMEWALSWELYADALMLCGRITESMAALQKTRDWYAAQHPDIGLQLAGYPEFSYLSLEQVFVWARRLSQHGSGLPSLDWAGAPLSRIDVKLVTLKKAHREDLV